MTTFDTASLNLGHLQPAHVSYEPKGLHTEAILVTPDNIGKLSLEFEAELLFNTQGQPYFWVTAARLLEQDTDETGMTGSTRFAVKVSDWIVPLRGEIHLYPDALFRTTFTFDVGEPQVYLPDLLHEIGEEHTQAVG